MACAADTATACLQNASCLWADACFPAEFNCALVPTDAMCAATPNCAWLSGCREAAHDCGRYDRETMCALHGCAWANTVCTQQTAAEQGGAELPWVWYALFAFLAVLVLRNLWQLSRSVWATTESTFEERQSLL